MANSPHLGTVDADSFLMEGGVPSASFLKPGSSVTGTICEPPVVRQQREMQTNQPKTWDDGSPMYHLVVTLQTDERDPELEDDDGRRRIYVKFNLKKAVADAVRKSGAKSLAVGGKLTVKYTHDGEPTKRGFSPPKFYEAMYVPPADNFLGSPDPDDADDTIIQSWDEAVAHAKDCGITEDQLKSAFRSNGITKWNSLICSPIVLEVCGSRPKPILNHDIPF